MNRRDLASGVLVAGTGLGVALSGIGYGVGTFSAMGAGFFPLALGSISVLLGLGIFVPSLFGQDPGHIERPAWRPLLGVSAAVLLFALLVPTVGLVPGVAVAAAVLALADSDARPLEVVLLSVGLALLCWLIFIFLLGLPIFAFRMP